MDYAGGTSETARGVGHLQRLLLATRMLYLAHQQPGAEGTDVGKANPDNTSESAATPGY